MARRRRSISRWQATRRIEALLDSARGKGRQEYDRRDLERGPRARRLDLQRHGRLFDRLAVLDFEYLLSLDFAAEPEMLRLLLPQSVLGRAQNGHGFWRDEDGTPLAFRDATFDRVLTALEVVDPQLKAPTVRRARGWQLDRLTAHVMAHLDRREMPLEDDEGPLLGAEMLRGEVVRTRDFARGLVLAGWMDDLDQRRMTMSHHRHTFRGRDLDIGGGRTYVVRPELLAAVGIVDAGRGEFTAADVRRLKDAGVIASEDREYSRPEFDQVYVRRRLGEGVCDDLALIWIGARHGWAAYLGAFVMDAVDTYDKYLWQFRPGGVDGRLAAAVQQGWKEHHGSRLVAGDEFLDLIRVAAKANDPECGLSSSHRRFLQTEQGSKVPTLRNHWRFLTGEAVYDIELGYSRFPARKFYDIARKRLAFMNVEIPSTSFVPRRGARF